MAARFFFAVITLLAMLVVATDGSTLATMAHSFTTDLTVMCNLTSFLAAHRDDYATITDIKVLQRTPRQSTDHVLVTWTTTGEPRPLASDHLLDSHRVFDVSNFHYNRTDDGRAHFHLLYTDLGLYDYGQYSCRVHYLTKDDYTLSTFNASVMTLLPGTTHIQRPGSALKLETGLALTCTFTSDTDLNANGFTVRVVPNRGFPNASEGDLARWQHGNLTHCATITACRAVTVQNPPAVTNTLILRAHLQRVNCEDEGTHSCLVERGGRVVFNASTVVERVSGCPVPTPPPVCTCNCSTPTGVAVRAKADGLLLCVVCVHVVMVVFGLVGVFQKV